MIETIKIDGTLNYFYDTSAGKVIDKYDPANINLELVINADDSVLRVHSSKIKKDYGGQIIVQHNNDRYIIDDGYQNTLIKAGYIVFRDHDHINELDQHLGMMMRNNIIDNIRASLRKIDDPNMVTYYTGNQTRLSVSSLNFNHEIFFDTISSIVTKNHERMNNALPYYPFIKGMDKYGAIYVSLFARRKDGSSNEGKYKIANSIISDLVMELGPDYHFVSVPINRRVILPD